MRKKIRLQGKLIIAMAAILGISGTTIGAMALVNQPEAVIVESFTGKQKNTVETWRKNNEISTDQVVYSYEYDEEKDKDIVLKQSIRSGTVFKSSDVLKITLSKGADPDKEFELPDFTGKNEKEVKAWFTDNRFTTVTYSYELSDTVAPETFISMDPEAGTTVKRSDEVKVVICTPLNAEEIIAPSFTGMTKDQLTQWADENRINLSFYEQANDSVPAGEIVSVSASQGDRLKAGDTVYVEISSGPQSEENREQPGYKEENNNVTPPANVSGGEPSGSTNTSNNQPITPEPTPEPEPTPVYTMPYIDLELADGMSVGEIQNYVSGIVAGAGIPGSINFGAPVNSEFNGILQITPAGTQIGSAADIVCVIGVNQ
ncbi:MAG: PASTA domain-containing protein [Bulleidia sp.]